ncbi:MAG: GHKL domain-containing protein [Phycisphaeraceae bacterium]|nr:GHKL domain-containing protein [Phycisphaeraceae bacterium]
MRHRPTSQAAALVDEVAPRTGEPALPPAAAAPTAKADERLDDLAQIIRAYNQVTENLRKSHEGLQAQVARLREELASTNAQLQRSKRLAALGEMAAGISHEIRNPLAAIGLYARMLVEDLPALDGSQACQDVAGKIASAVRSLNAVVGDVLNFSREMAPKRQHIDASALISGALDAQAPAIAATGIAVQRLDQQPGDDVPLWADPQLMHQALVNLIRNAVEAMAEKQGGSPLRTRTLTLDAHRHGESTLLIVRDTGPGIPAEVLERIFNPFFTTRSTGTGLGLAIVHRIVDAHGGAIAVAQDDGAVFEITLPSPPKPSIRETTPTQDLVPEAVT